jgi:hypothetical protein
VHHWNLPSEWVTSKKQTHEPLVSEADFRQAQRHGHTSARPDPGDHPRTIYVQEDHLTARIIKVLAERHDEPDVTDQGQIANYLRGHHLVITYDGANLTIDSGGTNINTQLALFPA